jgi:Fe-S cluster biogenesis protein NfuA
MVQDKNFHQSIQRIEGLIQEVERYQDPAAKAHTREMVQAVLDLHGAGLEKMLEILAEAGEPGLALIDNLARDDLVSSLLLLYGLHPLDLETRVRQALDKVRPYLRSHGGNVELLSTEGGVVRLRLQGSCDGCPSSAVTMKSSIEEAIYEKAPDVAGIEVAAVEESVPVAVDKDLLRVALPILQG